MTGQRITAGVRWSSLCCASVVVLGCAPRETTVEAHVEHRVLTTRTDYAEAEIQVHREGERLLLRLGTTTYCRESQIDRYVNIQEEKGRPDAGIFIAELALLAGGLALVLSCRADDDHGCLATDLVGYPLLAGGMVASGIDLLDFRTRRSETLLSENPTLKRKQACAFEPSVGREVTLVTDDGERAQFVTNANGEVSTIIPGERDVDVLVDGKPERHLRGAKPKPSEASETPEPLAPQDAGADAP